MSKISELNIFNIYTFYHKREYDPNEDCIVDKFTTITIFGHKIKRIKTIVMPFGSICNNCVWNGAIGEYANRQQKPCSICPVTK